MTHRLSKKITIFLTLVAVVMSFGRPVFADSVPVDCTNLTDPSNDTEVGPAKIICPVLKLLNIVVLTSGAAFVSMIFISAYKFAMSQGDPKGVQGARLTATYAVIGFLGVLFVFAILNITVTIFGLKPSVLNPFANFYDALNDLLDWADVTT